MITNDIVFHQTYEKKVNRMVNDKLNIVGQQSFGSGVQYGLNFMLDLIGKMCEDGITVTKHSISNKLKEIENAAAKV